MNKFAKIVFSLLLLTSVAILNAHCGHCGCCNNNSSCCNNYCCDDKSCGCDPCECRVQARSTFVVRPQFQVGSPEYLAAFRDRMHANENGHGGALRFSLFGGKSTNADRLATYFTPFCKSRLLVKTNEDEPARDIDPQHFNVTLAEGDFQSTINFCPKISTVGLGITYRQDLSRLRDDCDPCKCHWWFEISTPLTRVETTMGLSECITTTAELKAADIADINQTFYASMKNAFNQSAWYYGKINGCCKCAKTRLADISVLLGFESVKCEGCLLEGYAGFLIPTGNARCGTYVFEPIVGHGKHWGIIKGWHLKMTVWENEDECRRLEIANDSNGLYLFKREEIRSFDLKCKPWSRYMEVYKNKAQAEEAATLEGEGKLEAAQYLSSPGINTFTQCLRVWPRLTATTNSAFIFSGKRFKGEIGYNLHCKQSECVELCCWKEGVALKAEEGGGNTQPLRTINEANSILEANVDAMTELTGCDATCFNQGINVTVPVDKYDQAVIKASDIDLESATHPDYFAHTVYFSAGGRWDEKEYPWFFDVGGSYEFGNENKVLSRWTAWVQGGLTF